MRTALPGRKAHPSLVRALVGKRECMGSRDAATSERRRQQRPSAPAHAASVFSVVGPGETASLAYLSPKFFPPPTGLQLAGTADGACRWSRVERANVKPAVATLTLYVRSARASGGVPSAWECSSRRQFLSTELALGKVGPSVA